MGDWKTPLWLQEGPEGLFAEAGHCNFAFRIRPKQTEEVMLEFETTYPIIRVYFNRRDEFPEVWSVDDDNQANEINVSQIITQGIGQLKYIGGGKHQGV